MRGMIVAAGLGTRLRPLTRLLPKPALPVRGVPLVAYPLALLASAGVREVVINLHHLPERLREAALRACPPGITLRFSLEEELLHTGGAIRRVADFLGAEDPCVIVGGDMVVDLDLPGLLKRHRESGRDVTLVLRDDPRVARFGSIGLDDAGRLRRIGQRFDLGGATRSGLYTWVNVVSAKALESLPERRVFNHLDDWLAPLATAGGAVGGEILSAEACVWEPVGTPWEYLEANFKRLPLRTWHPEELAGRAGARLSADAIVGAGASLGRSACLERVVVWDGEKVPEGARLRDGVFAGGTFHPCSETRFEEARS